VSKGTAFGIHVRDSPLCDCQLINSLCVVRKN
jgi:hypothetical protein